MRGEWGLARRRWRPGDADAVTCPLEADGGSASITADEIRRCDFTDALAICARLAGFDDEVGPPLLLVEA